MPDIFRPNNFYPLYPMEFRADINALRAIAVFIVCFFHFKVPGFEGGFSGVDVFFVISGFLMTRIIVSKFHTNTFSLKTFYQDRALRIIPALSMVVIFTIIAGWFLLQNFEYQILGAHVVATMGFFSNILFQHEAGYFDQMSQKKWLLHTWSLSVEWQFYLLYPLFLLFLSHFLKRISRENHLRWIVLGITAISIIWCVQQTKTSPSAAFYGLSQRSWEMLAGGLIYFFPVNVNQTLRRCFACLGLVMISGATVYFDEQLAWPGWWAQIPVLGCALVIWSRSDLKIFSFKPVQNLGSISYSVYLWHWPLVVMLNYFEKQQKIIWVAAAISLSVMLGIVSYSLIETKWRRWFVQSKKPWLGLFFVCLLIAAFGRLIVKLDGIPSNIRAINLSESTLFLQHYEQMHLHGLAEFYRLECDFYNADTKKARDVIPDSCTPSTAAGGVFLWGDSHAQALSHGIRQSLKIEKSLAQVATSGCRPSQGSQLHFSGIENNCDKSNQYALKAIALLKPDLVILAQESAHEKTNWIAMAEHLHSLGVKNVTLIGPVPQWRPSLPKIIVTQHWGDNEEYIKDGLDAGIVSTNTVLKERYADTTQLKYISLFDALCNLRGCLARLPESKILMAVDYGHLTPDGSIYVSSKAILPKLTELNYLRQSREFIAITPQ